MALIQDDYVQELVERMIHVLETKNLTTKTYNALCVSIQTLKNAGFLTGLIDLNEVKYE